MPVTGTGAITDQGYLITQTVIIDQHSRAARQARRAFIDVKVEVSKAD
jgi:hypothetical protein